MLGVTSTDLGPKGGISDGFFCSHVQVSQLRASAREMHLVALNNLGMRMSWNKMSHHKISHA